MSSPPPQRMTVPAAVAKIVGKEAPYAQRLAAARGETLLAGRDLVTALYLLYCGGEPEIRAAVIRTLRQQPAASLALVAEQPDLPPRILHFLAQVRSHEPLLFGTFLDNPACSHATMLFLLEHAERCLFPLIFARERLWRPFPEAVSALLLNPLLTAAERSTLLSEEDPSPLVETPVDEPDDEEEEAAEIDSSRPDEENYSKYQLALGMGVTEKIKMALTGDKEWRSIFLKDSNKLVNTAVLKNPRVTDGEVLAVTKSNTSSEELIRLILVNKEWMKLRIIRSALVSHPKTPVPQALRCMTSLSDKELKALGKSKSVSQVVVSAARRILAEKAKKQ